MSMLDRDDFAKLGSRGLHPLESKKLERWCDTVTSRAENMLSLNTPPGTVLLSLVLVCLLVLMCLYRTLYLKNVGLS